METRKLIERAKGLLQAKHQMTEPEAFSWMQRAAMDRRTTMKRVAEVVLETLDNEPDARVGGLRRRHGAPIPRGLPEGWLCLPEASLSPLR